MQELRIVDLVVGGILAIALVRGLGIGLIREAFSLAALGGAVVAVRLGSDPLGAMIAERTDVDALYAPWIAGGILAMATVTVVAVIGRWLRRGAVAAGLGWVDRLGGAALGTLEGAVVAGVLLTLSIAALGRDAAVLKDTRSLAAFTELEQLAGDEVPRIDVAAPPR